MKTNILGRHVLAWVTALMMVACGGGGSDAPLNNPPVARAGPGQAAVVGTAVVLDGSASSDSDGDAVSYAWSLASTPTGSAASLSAATSARPSFTPDRAGAYTVSLVVSDGKASSAASTVTVTAAAPALPTIVLSQAEPVADTVRLSLSAPVAGTVTWYADLLPIGSADASTGGAVDWNTTLISNGTHLLLARIEAPGAAAQEVRRTVTVTNSSVRISVSVSGSTGSINVDVSALSSFGITRVSATLDGADAGSLTSPNGCSRFCQGTNDIYRFVVDAARVGSGAHTMVITAVDTAGGTRTATQSVPVSNAPVIALTGPADGAFVNGRLQLSGTATTDKSGMVTVVARLGAVEFLRTTAAPGFVGTLDLAGLTPGTYTLSIQATDSTTLTSLVERTLVVTSDSRLVYTPLFALPADASLLALDGTKLLYLLGNGTAVLRDTTTSAEMSLPGAAALLYRTDWQLSGGRVYVEGKDADCVVTFPCIYQWDAAGVRTNLSIANPFSGTSYQQHPVAKNGYVIWSNSYGSSPGGSYTLYNVAARSYTQVSPPPGVGYIGNADYDFAVVNGVVHFFYWAQTGNVGGASTFDTFAWRSDTGVSTQLSLSGAINAYTQTDGIRAAWQQRPADRTSSAAFTLVATPLAGAPLSTLSTTASAFLLEDGVLAWSETAAGATVVKASPSIGVVSLLAQAEGRLYASGGGHVVFANQGRTYSWNAATGISTLRLDVLPSQAQVLLSGNVMVFTIASTVYRVTLN